MLVRKFATHTTDLGNLETLKGAGYKLCCGCPLYKIGLQLDAISDKIKRTMTIDIHKTVIISQLHGLSLEIEEYFDKIREKGCIYDAKTGKCKHGNWCICSHYTTNIELQMKPLSKIQIQIM